MDLRFGSLGKRINCAIVTRYSGRDSPICHIGFNETQHLLSGLRSLDKNTIVNLQEAKKLENLARFRSDFIHTIEG